MPQLVKLQSHQPYRIGGGGPLAVRSIADFASRGQQRWWTAN
jgi:hypothetical protein